MAHLNQTAAIFSPSVARAAASTAKDWSYIDSWLRTKYAGHTPPAFERNPDTLRALLALAAQNEAADEERHQLARVEEAALNEVKEDAARKAEKRHGRDLDSMTCGRDSRNDSMDITILDGELIRDDMLQAVEQRLTRDGRAALDAMASMAIELGIAYPTPEMLASQFVQIQGKAFELEETMERVALLQKYLDRESESLHHFIQDLNGQEYKPDADLAKQNLELQRQIKTMSAKLPELKQHAKSLEKSLGLPTLTVEDVRKDEEAYLQLLATKKHLDAQVRAFAGLPPDVQAARSELEALRTQLRSTTENRDAIFEGLVERESPVKTRRRP